MISRIKRLLFGCWTWRALKQTQERMAYFYAYRPPHMLGDFMILPDGLRRLIRLHGRLLIRLEREGK